MPFTMRWIPIVAWHFSVTAVVLALINLLTGANGSSSLESLAIITFNTSALGLAEYASPNSTLHPTLTSLILGTPANPSSITRYLGIKDWYSLHYLSTCSGFYLSSTRNPINITCTPHMSGYSFSLQDTLRSELYPNLKSLADEITPREYYTAPWVALLYIGLICAMIELCLLPLTWFGTKRLNGYCFLLAFISYISLHINGSLTTTRALAAHHDAVNITLPSSPQNPIYSLSPYPSAFLGFTWSAMACMVIVLLCEALEWRFELWTLKGERITIWRKPATKSWSLMDALASRKPVEMVGEEGIELGSV